MKRNFLLRENYFGFSREARSELGGLNRLRFLCAYVVKHGSMAKVALAEVSKCTLSDLRQRRGAYGGELVRASRASHRNFGEHPWLPWGAGKVVAGSTLTPILFSTALPPKFGQFTCKRRLLRELRDEFCWMRAGQFRLLLPHGQQAE
jgi:hypothetical protein